MQLVKIDSTQWVANWMLGDTSGNFSVVSTGASRIEVGDIDRIEVHSANNTNTYDSGKVRVGWSL